MQGSPTPVPLGPRADDVKIVCLFLGHKWANAYYLTTDNQRVMHLCVRCGGYRPGPGDLFTM